jgi:PAS domain S-box-containing protein
MVRWQRFVTKIGGQRIVLVLGLVFVVSALARALYYGTENSLSSVFIVTLFIGAPGLILVVGGYRLPRSDIRSELYLTVAKWTLAGFGAMIAILVVYHVAVSPISNPTRGVPILTAFSSAAGYGIGVVNAQEKTRTLELRQRARQQQAVSDLGQFALESDDLDELMHQATTQVADVLDNEYCKVLDLDSENQELLLRQGVGWKDGYVGEATVSSIESDSQAAYTLANDHPIVVEDLETETRFSGPQLLIDHDVRSGISVVIGSFDDPWGILGTHGTGTQNFTDEDINFVQSVANVLAEAIERHHYQQELRHVRDRMEFALNATDAVVWDWDVENDRASFYPSAESLYGTTIENWDDFIAIIHPEDRQKVQEGIEHSLETGESKDEEIRIVRDEEVRWVEAPGYPVSEDGGPKRMVGVARDITERKMYERKLAESNERLEQFAYAASHDLQEPLRMVSSYLQLIEQRYELDEDGQEFLEFAIDGSDRMRSMIDGLLEYSRVETQGDPLQSLKLETVLDDVREDLQVKIEETNATITVDSLPQITGDPHQLRQVFQNLIDNAIQYSDGQPTVHIYAQQNGTEWIISVEDEGVGIDVGDQERIFEVFQRIQRDGNGTGIGLALCKRIIERHGGEIWVESDPGEGATFAFTLPAQS